MKKKATFALPYDVDSGAVPSGMASMASAYQQAFQNAADHTPLSLKLFGRGQEWQNALQNAWVKRMSDIGALQKSADEVMGPRNAWNERQRDIAANNPKYTPPEWQTPAYDQAGNMSGFQTPDTPFIPEEAQKSLYSSRLGPSDIKAQIGLMPGVANQAMGMLQPPGDGKTLQARVGMQDIQLPTAIGNPETLMNNIGEVFRTGLTQGTEKYKFDQEAPKRQAEIDKLTQEAKNLIAEGKIKEAEAKIRQIQAKYAEQREKAEIGSINRSNTSGSSGRAPTMLEMMSPGQREAYFNKEAGLGPRQMSIEDTQKMVDLQTAAEEKEWLTGQPTTKAINAQAVLQRLNSGPAVARPVPMNRPIKHGIPIE